MELLSSEFVLVEPFKVSPTAFVLTVLASLPTIDSMLKPIFCLGVGIITADVGTGGIILVINTRF